jgi:hypothetical protein
MGEQFTCPNCRQPHRFHAELAGQPMHCHGCGFVFRSPLVPLAPAEGLDVAGTRRWRLRLAGGRQFGPVRRDMIEEWLREGRADGDSLVSPEESGLWYRVTEAFPEMPAAAGPNMALPGKTKTSPVPEPPADSLTPGALIPAAGLLDLLENCADEPPTGRLRVIQRQHAAALASLQAECAAARGLIRLRASSLVWLEPDETPRTAGRSTSLEPEAATVAACLGPQGGEFYVIIPWSQLGRLPHEFLSILPGRLSAPLALRRASDEDSAGGRWIGITGDDRDILAIAAGSSREALADGIGWDWRSHDRRYQTVLVWGLQALPLGTEKFAHLIQTAGHPDPAAPAGLRWYLERQSAFYRFARRLNLPGASGSPVLFASAAAQLLVLAADRAAAPSSDFSP